MKWWKPGPGSFDQAQARAIWELIVELRLAVPEIELDSLAEKATEVRPWVDDRWPTFSEEIAEIIEGLRNDPASPQYRLRMEALADELEDHLGTGLR